MAGTSPIRPGRSPCPRSPTRGHARPEGRGEHVDPAPAQRRPGRPRRLGQDHPRRAPAPLRRAPSPALGASTTAPPASTSSPRSRSASCRCRSRWRRWSTTGTASRSSTRPATPTSWARSSRASRRRTRRSSPWTPRSGRGRHRDAPSALGRRHGHGRPLRDHPLRPRERRPDAGRSTRCAASSATRSRRSRWPSARRETFQGYVDLVHRTAWTCTRRASARRCPSRPSWRTRSRAAATSCWRRPRRPTTTSSPSTSRARRSPTRSWRRASTRGSATAILAPVLLTSAAQDIGIEGLLDAIVRYLPSPDEEPPVKATGTGGEIVEVASDRNGPLLLQVFKTTADPFVGRLTYFRVWSGTIRSHDHVWNASRGEEERIGQVLACTARTRSRRARSAPARSAPWPSSSTRSPATPSARARRPLRCPGSASPSRPCRWPSSRRPRPTWTS